MPYPSAPWNLNGFAIQTLQLVDIDQARPFVPAELGIVSVFPGKTLGGVYLARYGAESVLQYSELIVVSAIAHHHGKPGGWISHIYVDNADSVAGGREIWGLPKELAQFDWQMGNLPSVQVRQGNVTLCSLTCQWQLPLWQQPLALPSYSQLRSTLMTFEGMGDLSLNIVGTQLQIPPDSPFARLALNDPWLSFYANPLKLTAATPKVVGDR